MDIVTFAADAVKIDSRGVVRGYLVRYGNPDNVDLEGDFFTKTTDFGFPAGSDTRVPLNVYYHHGMDPKIGRKAIGTGYLKSDDTGLWYEAQLDMADEYAAMVAKLCKEGKMGLSSGAAGHLVERKTVGFASQITRWPIAEASITPTPAEPRNTVKSLADLPVMQYDEQPGMDMEGGEDEPMPMPAPEPGQDPAAYTDAAFSGSNLEVIHEGIEALYDALCSGIAGAALAAEPRPYLESLVQGFADRAMSLVGTIRIDGKSLDVAQPTTLREMERRLRDAVGLSRSEAKRLAPGIWEQLRDAVPVVGTDNTTTTGAREEMLARIEYMMEFPQ